MEKLSTMIKNIKKPGADSEHASTVRILDFVIFSIIALIFFICPLFFTGLVVQGLGFEKMILFYFLTLLGIVVWVTKGVILGELTLKRTPLDFPIMGLLAIFIVSTILSVNQTDSLIGSYGVSAKNLAALVIFILFYYLVVNNINIKKIKILFWSFIFSATLIIVYSFLQLISIFVIPFSFTKIVSFNPIGSLSSLTMFLVVALPLLVVAMTQIKNIHSRINIVPAIIVKFILGVIILVSLTVMSLLNGFIFWPAAIVSLVIILMFFLAKIIPVSSHNLVIPIATFLILITLLVLGNFNIMNLSLPAEVSLSRSASWDIAKSSIKANPVFGSGPATFYSNFSQFKNTDFNTTPLWNVRFDSASGMLFELLANVGILGALAAVIVTLIVLSICFLSLIKTSNKEIHSLLLALFASFISIIIFSSLFALSNSVILIFILLCILAISASITVYPEKFKSTTLTFRASAQYALALAAIFLSVSAGVIILFTLGLKMYLADFYAKEAVLAAGQEQKIEKMNKAIQLASYQDNFYINLANYYMLLANQEAVGSRDQTKIQGYLSSAIDLGKRALTISPNKASINESLALIYENASFYVVDALIWAENLYNKVIELDPNNPTPHLRIALINMARANADQDVDEQKFYIGEAIKKYEQAISKKSDLAVAYYGKGIASERLGQNEEAIEQLKQAVIFSQGNVNYRFELGRLYFNQGVTKSGLAQTAAAEIAASEISEGEEAGGEELSVEPKETISPTFSRNEDLNMAEQIFLGVLQTNPNHANALYSLSLLYQRLNETDNAKITVSRLLNILPEDQSKQNVREMFKGLY